MNDEQLMTTQEISTKSGYSMSWFIQHRLKGSGPPFHRLEGTVRYKWSDWEAFVASGRIEPRR